MGPLPAPVQPDQRQGCRRQQLHGQGDAPEGHIGAGQQPAVDHQHGRQLRKPPYMPLAAQGEHQHRQHPGAEIIGLQRLPQQIARRTGAHSAASGRGICSRRMASMAHRAAAAMKNVHRTF